MKLPVLSMALVMGVAGGWWSASRDPVVGDGRGGGPDPLASKERVAVVPVEVRSRVRQVPRSMWLRGSNESTTAQ